MRKLIDAWANSARSFGNVKLTIGSPLPYAYGIETGYHRGGRLARRAGGAFYLQKGMQAMQTIFQQRAASSLLGIPAGQSFNELLSTMQTTGLRVAQSSAPVRTGKLRGSIVASRTGRLR